MSNLDTVKAMYAAFGKGDLPGITAHMAANVSWEFEAPTALSWSGIRKGIEDAKGFFMGIAAEQTDPKLEMTDFLTSADSVAAFGRYEATVKSTGIRVNTPVGHLFKFDNAGKVVRYVNLVNSAAFVDAQKR
jgi:uncharacterized protein